MSEIEPDIQNIPKPVEKVNQPVKPAPSREESLPTLPPLPNSLEEIAGWKATDTKTPFTLIDLDGAPSETTAHQEENQLIPHDEVPSQAVYIDSLTEETVNDPDALFAWLQKAHSYDNVQALGEQDSYGVNPYDYEGVTPEMVKRAVESARDLFPDNPQALMKFVASLSPAQILIDAPFVSDEIMRKIAEEGFQKERERLQAFPDVQALLQPVARVRRFVHTTGIPETAQKIVENGLFASPSGIRQTAKGVSEADGILEDLVKRHKGGTAVVVIGLPNKLPPEYQQMLREKLADPTGIFIERVPEEEIQTGPHGEKIDHKLPSRYIQGYLNTTTGEFHENKNYNPILSEQKQKQILEHIRNL